ncbi:TetR/AcrR family transcriptional regulator [Rhizomonospora bruguierae]|uniref:TetR/AcrR family transcriptional regulator n=1 Tax=Rhizomonospora bruguierae TaxID=1581705 RepID=UPI001BCE07BB|nr:TetR/AcrR family transcriptional regulator [Micromonospora sp. NBRC 107566]
MPRAGLSPSSVVDAALAVIDERGAEALTLAAVAARTGVAAPSLYKHVGSLADLRVGVGVRIMDELTGRLGTAALGRSGDDAVTALMHECRAYVMQHPARYAAMPVDPLHNKELAAAGGRLLGVFLAVLRGYGMTETDAVHATRCLRAVVHGFATIQAAGGFGLPEDLDETYHRLVAMYVASLPRPERS